MKILLSNDDGYQAPGIVALHAALREIPGVDVDVVAPEHNNSAKSNALTLHSPLYVHQAANGFRYVNGTPGRLRAHRAHRAAGLPARPGRLRNQQRRQHGRRHHLFRHRGRGHGRLPVRRAGHRLFPGGQGMGRNRGGRAQGPRDGRADACAAPGRGSALAAERQHSQPAVRSAAPGPGLPPGPAPRGRAGDRTGRARAASACTGSAAPARPRTTPRGTDFHATALGHVALTP